MPDGILAILVRDLVIRLDIRQRRTWLNTVGGAQDQSTARRHSSQPFHNLAGHILRAAEWEGMLNVDCAPESQALTVLALDMGRIHRERLNRIQDVEANLNQVRDNGFDATVGVLGDLEGWILPLECSNQARIALFDELPPHAR